MVTTRLLLALALLSSPARADCQPDGDLVRCDVATLEAWRTATLDAEHDRDVALAGNKALEADARVMLAALEQAQARPAWTTVALVGGGGIVLGVVLGLLAR